MSENDIKRIEITCQQLVASGCGQIELIANLKRARLSIIDAIKIVRSVYKINLGEAKRLVTGHTAWTNDARDGDVLHQEFIDYLKAENEGELIEFPDGTITYTMKL